MYAQRRQTLMENMAEHSVGLWFASPVRNRSRDTDHRYRASSDMLYLSGCDEPEAILVLRPDAQEERVVLFVRPRDPQQEIWHGRRLGPERAKEHYDVDATYTIDEFAEKIVDYLVDCQNVYYSLGIDPRRDQEVLGWIQKAKRQRRLGKTTPHQLIDAVALVHEQRLCKDDAELAIMRRAADLTAEAHRMAMQVVKPGLYEYQLEALMQYHFRKHGCLDFSYQPIVGGGANATILHYTENTDMLQDGDLVLIDAGAELDFYAADITRTFPVNGTFSPQQRDVYQIVLDALNAGIDACQPGKRFNDVHDAALRVLTQGLIDLKVLDGDLDTLLEEEAYKPYYMHKTGHWLGLDVHDVGAYFIDGNSRVFAPGMVLTVEPGLYFNPDFHSAPEAEPFANIGIRVEDNILITTNGNENLTANAPKTIDDIQSIAQSLQLP